MIAMEDRAFEKLPPHSIESEMCLIGSVMVDREAWEDSREIVDRDCFYQSDHQLLWDVCSHLYSTGGAVDGALVREELVKRGLYEEVGGLDYLRKILNKVPSHTHAKHYAAVVAEKAKLRQLIFISNEVLRTAYAASDSADQADDIARKLETSAAGIRDASRMDTVRSIGSFVDEVLKQKRDGVESRIPFGFADLDELVAGMPIGGMTYIAGRAGMGKSQVIKQVLKNIAMRGIPVGLVSIEEPGGKIAKNLLSNMSGIENSKIVQNRPLGEEEWAELERAGENLKAIPFFVDDAQRKISSIEASIRRLVRKHGCKVIGVDHLHLIDGETDANRTQEVTKISASLKASFKSLAVPGLVALQMNRRKAQEEGAAPDTDQLRDSEALVFDGDLILQLHREDYYNWKKAGADFKPDHCLQVFINKNKDGAVGARQLYFDGNTQYIGDWNNGYGPCSASNIPHRDPTEGMF